MQNKEREVTFEVVEHFGVINTNAKGWKKELNLVAWNGNSAKYDVREWDEHHERMSKGITLTEEEMKALTVLLTEVTANHPLPLAPS